MSGNSHALPAAPAHVPLYPSSGLYTLTPEVAAAWKLRNTRNRPLREERAERYAAAMSRGEWEANGEPIIFDNEGRVHDGQHRIEAVIRAGRPIETWVTFGVPARTFGTVDQGDKRTGGDALSLLGAKNYNVLAAALTWLWRHELGQMAGKVRPTKVQLLQTHRASPGLGDSVAFVRDKLPAGVLRSYGTLAFLHFILSRIDREGADEFMGQAAGGAGLAAGDPAYRLRERLVQNATAKAKLPAHHVIALFIKAWNAYRAGRRVESLRWATNESFPEAQ